MTPDKTQLQQARQDVDTARMLAATRLARITELEAQLFDVQVRADDRGKRLDKAEAQLEQAQKEREEDGMTISDLQASERRYYDKAKPAERLVGEYREAREQVKLLRRWVEARLDADSVLGEWRFDLCHVEDVLNRALATTEGEREVEEPEEGDDR